MLAVGMMASFYLFPFEFKSLPGFNVKMMLAVVGLVFMAWNILRKKEFSVSSELIFLFVLAGAISLAALLSITINQTPDNSYVYYVISFTVWLSASYAVCFCVTSVHDRIDVMLIIDYLVGVCVFQCIGAVLIETSPFINEIVNSHMEFEQRITIRVGRLYGPGSLLDMAGTRFSLVLVGISFFLSNFSTPLKTSKRIAYILSFLIISVIGNMIARTTLVGMALGIGIIVLSFIIKPDNTGDSLRTSIGIWSILIIVAVVISTVLYNSNENARRLFRFGFEGFFALAEKGYWETNSTEILKDMVVFPESLHTWFIGDGYFMNTGQNENYLGNGTNSGYYMSTDIGYLRFIFYFGLVGLMPMLLLIISSSIICMKEFKCERFLFFAALLVGLIIWFKVSTDIFFFFALFISASILGVNLEKDYA